MESCKRENNGNPAPQFDKNGKKTKSGAITVLHNGVLIQDHYEIKDTSQAPIYLEDHVGYSRVSYRNLWVCRLN
ncbi:hypothetical protein KH5_05280 [Urechidicola sp. KH5]